MAAGPAGLGVPAPLRALLGCLGVMGMVVEAPDDDASSVFTVLSISPTRTLTSRRHSLLGKPGDIVPVVPVVFTCSLFLMTFLLRRCEPLPLPSEPPLLGCLLGICFAATEIVDAGVLGV